MISRKKIWFILTLKTAYTVAEISWPTEMGRDRWNAGLNSQDPYWPCAAGF